MFTALALLSALTTAPQAPSVVENARWLVSPSSERAAAYMPVFANSIGVDGYASVVCEVERVGPPERCEVMRESPRGLGFGDAALQIAQLGILTPRRVNGKPVRGQISFAVPFHAYPLEIESPSPYLGPEPTEAALALARDLVRRDLALIKKASDADLYHGLSPDRIPRVRPWMEELWPMNDEQIVDYLGLATARVLTLEQLQSYSESGVFPFADVEAMPDAVEAAFSDLFTIKDSAAWIELRRRYCAVYECKGGTTGSGR